MRFHREWRAVLVRAWSVRLNVISAILSGLEVWFSFVDPYSLPIPHGMFAALAGFVTIGSNIARVVVQRNLTNAGK